MRYWYLLVVVALQILLGSCDLECRFNKSDRVHAEWCRNEGILQRAIWGVSNSEELGKSLLFFYKLTGISVRGNYGTFGFFPTRETKDDLRILRKWYKVNRDNLYWDEKAQAVKLRKT
jgi:hypothetical protein